MVSGISVIFCGEALALIRRYEAVGRPKLSKHVLRELKLSRVTVSNNRKTFRVIGYCYSSWGTKRIAF